MNKSIVRAQHKARKLKLKRASPTKEPGIWVTIGGKRERYYRAVNDNVDLGVTDTSEHVRITFCRLSKWPDEFHWSVFEQLKNVRRLSVRPQMDKPETTDLFDAVLTLISRDDSIERSGNIRRTICEAAALCYPQHVDEAVDKIKKCYRSLDMKPPSKLADTIRGLVGSSSGGRGSSGGDALRLAISFMASLNSGEPDEIPSLLRYRQRWFRWVGDEWRDLADDELEAMVIRHVQQQGGYVDATRNLFANIEKNLKGLYTPIDSRLEMPLWLGKSGAKPTKAIACLNGRIRLDKLDGKLPKLLKPSKRHFSTARLGFNYDPEAKCPRWLQALQEILPAVSDDDRRIEVFQQFCGWCLFPQAPRFDKFLILQGKGGNGKSQLLHVLRALLGAGNCSSIGLDKLGGEFTLAEMEGKLANIAGDTKHVDQFAEDVVKRITSGEPVTINRKHKQPYEAVMSAKLVIATNPWPTVEDKSDGMWRRIIAMPFRQQFDDATSIKDFAARNLIPELSGIAIWAIRGLLSLLKDDKFAVCGVCERELVRYRQRGDSVRQFIDQECEFVIKEKMTRCVDLYEAYNKWCLRNNYRPLASGKFHERMEEDFGKPKKREPRRQEGRPRKEVYRGIGLKYHGPGY